MFTMKSRPLMLCALFMACTAMSQPIARFLWTPVVRPFDYRPAYGANAYNPENTLKGHHGDQRQQFEQQPSRQMEFAYVTHRV